MKPNWCQQLEHIFGRIGTEVWFGNESSNILQNKISAILIKHCINMSCLKVRLVEQHVPFFIHLSDNSPPPLSDELIIFSFSFFERINNDWNFFSRLSLWKRWIYATKAKVCFANTYAKICRPLWITAHHIIDWKDGSVWNVVKGNFPVVLQQVVQTLKSFPVFTNKLRWIFYAHNFLRNKNLYKVNKVLWSEKNS